MSKRNIIWQLSIFTLLIIAGAIWHINNQKNDVLTLLALDNARRINHILNEVRVLYTTKVIPTAIHFGIPVSQGDKINEIPLPASFSKILSERISNGLDNAHSQLYSPFPFIQKDKTIGGLKDDFSKNAWKFLLENPTKPYYEFQHKNSGLILRYATADILQPECVNCHNTHPNSPKTDWKAGDVRGILEISLPVYKSSNPVNTQITFATQLLFIFITLIVCGASFFIWRQVKSEDLLNAQLKDKIRILKTEQIELLRYRHIISSSNDMIAFMDLNYIYRMVNQRYLEIFKIQHDSIIGRSVAEIMDVAVFKQVIKPKLDQAYHGKTVTWQTWMQTPSGKFYFNISYNPLIDESNTIIGVTASIQDRTESHKTEEALRRSQKMDAIGQLSGGIAHDFNNILGIIIGNLEFLNDQVSDEKTKRRLQTIQKSAQRAVILTKQLLGFSRIQPNKLEVVNINLILNSMENLITRSVTPQIIIERQLSRNLNLIEIGKGDFEDVMINLILNARDAMPKGGKIVIKTSNFNFNQTYCSDHPGTVPGDYVEVSVADNGVGIDSAALEHIFEPFYTTKDVGKGTGLGLAMVFGFIQRSNAYIKAIANTPGGTIFIMHFPVVNDSAKNVCKPPNSEKKALPEGTETILIVDDEIDLLELSKNQLRSLGYQVITATNGQQALDVLHENDHIDLLFSDILMPGMSGFDLVVQAKKHQPQLKVILTSGYSDNLSISSEHSALAEAILHKPYRRIDIAHKLREILKH